MYRQRRAAYEGQRSRTTRMHTELVHRWHALQVELCKHVDSRGQVSDDKVGDLVEKVYAPLGYDEMVRRARVDAAMERNAMIVSLAEGNWVW